MLAGALQISSIPTLMAFRDGIMVFRQAGALPAPALEELITAVRGLDMDDVASSKDRPMRRSRSGRPQGVRSALCAQAGLRIRSRGVLPSTTLGG